MNSRLYLPLALSLLILAAPLARPAQAQLGIAAGLNYSSFGDIEDDVDASFDNSSGYHIGLFYDLAVGPLALRPGLYYMDVGAFAGEEGRFDGEDFDLSLVEAAVDVRLRFGAGAALAPYLLAGPVLRFPDSDDEEVREALEEVNVAGSVGAGLELNVLGLRLFPEVRYTFGLSGLARDGFEIGGQRFEVGEEDRLNPVIVRLGVAF